MSATWRFVTSRKSAEITTSTASNSISFATRCFSKAHPAATLADDTLRLPLKPATDARCLRANWNGKAIEIVATMGWFESHVVADSVKCGENRLELTLAGDSPKKVQWTDLVLQVRPGK